MPSRLPTASYWALAFVTGIACSARLGDGADGTDASTSTPDAPQLAIDASTEPDASPPADAAPCVEGDARFEDPNTGRCYIYVAALTSWQDASVACVGLGAHLATALSLAENQAITPLAGLLDVWIGGTDEATEALWLWLTGEAMGFTNWRQGEPNDGATNGENCMVLEGDNDGVWDDRSCGNNYGYICERE